MVDFYVNLVSCDLAKLANPRSLLVNSLGLSTETIMGISRDSSVSTFPVFCLPFVSFSCFIALARTSSMMFDRNGQSGHPYLVTYLSGKPFSLSSLGMRLAVHVLKTCFVILRVFPSICSLLRVFVMNCWILSCFFCIHWFAHVLFILLYTVNMLNYINWFLNIEPPLYSQDKPHLVLVHYFALLIYYRDQWEFLHLFSWGILIYAFFVLYLSHFCIRIMLVSWIENYSLLFCFSGKHHVELV